MKKYFIVSDVHGFYDELIRGLEIAGFSPSNPNHIFVSLGDLFDRGPKSYECLQFVNSLPEDRKILIKGNHEWLLEDILIKKYYERHDLHNKTNETIEQFYLSNHEKLSSDLEMIEWVKNWEEYNKYKSQLKDYYIYKDNLFVHGWVPHGCHTLTEIKKESNYNWYDATWIDGALYCVKWGIKIRTSKRKGSRLVTVFCGHVHSFYLNYKYHHSGIIDGSDISLDKIDCTPFIDE